MPDLTSQQVRFFRDQGFLRLPGALDNGLVARLAEAVRAAFDEAPDATKVYHLYQRQQPLIDELIRDPALVAPLRGLLGPHIVFLTNRHNCAIRRAGGNDRQDHRLHRDVLQWSRPLVTVLVYLEESTVANGCTQVIPGSHLIPFVESGATGGTWMDEHDRYADLAGQALPVPMPAGSALALDATVFHAAGPSTSPGTRLSIALGFRSVDELDAHAAEQRTVLVAGEHLYRGNDRNGVPAWTA